ncbi:MAG: T9SS type A sorting domain-containing protein [Weeksellaceae bacterium]|nr:T9SS type A sorting domain-containing protein [Bacteroidota bacterium]MCG2781675.1 T9SS type A sorting domain-containing protein [Weeksellaceae bacterium]
MKRKFIPLVLVFGNLFFAQNTISFNGCHNLFEDQNFTFFKTGVDGQNKNIYITNPVDGEQPCGGLGTCEFKIQWNNTLTRWEFLADSGNGDFVNPFLIYYNATGNSSALNPPSNNVGTWVENVAVTENGCSGSLTAANSTMTGDVHTSTLAVSNSGKGKIQMFPNPVSDYISFSGVEKGKTLQIFGANGQLIRTESYTDRMNVNSLSPGVYVLKVISANGTSSEFKFIKK